MKHLGRNEFPFEDVSAAAAAAAKPAQVLGDAVAAAAEAAGIPYPLSTIVLLEVVPLFAPTAQGNVVLRADTSVVLCSLGALLTVALGGLPVPSVRWDALPNPSLGP